MKNFILIPALLLGFAATTLAMQDNTILGLLKPKETITTRWIELPAGKTTVEVIADEKSHPLICKFVDADGNVLSEQHTDHCLINAVQPQSAHFTISLTNTQEDKAVFYKIYMHDTK
jgi:hypothetical protein